MFSIEKIIFKEAEAVEVNDYYVHPFYQTTFCRLYGKEESEVKVEEGVYPRDNYEFLIPVLQELVAGREKEISHFYDVRTTEEFSQPAPEYALLKGAGLQRTAPLGVKGMGAFALPFALVLAENSVEENKFAVILCAEIYTPADGEKYRNSRRGCCGFLLRKGSADQVQGKNCVLAYRFHMTREEIEQYIKDHCTKTDHVTNYKGDSLMDSLAVLNKAQEEGASDFLIIWKQGESYGFLHTGRR